MRIEIQKVINGKPEWKRNEDWSLDGRGTLSIRMSVQIPGRRRIQGTAIYRRER